MKREGLDCERREREIKISEFEKNWAGPQIYIYIYMYVYIENATQ